MGSSAELREPGNGILGARDMRHGIVQLCNCAIAELPNAELPLHIRNAPVKHQFVHFVPLVPFILTITGKSLPFRHSKHYTSAP